MEKENAGSFKDWVAGGIELVKPWKWSLIFTNLFWAVVLAIFIALAYMTPETSYQSQNFDDRNQTQSSGVVREVN